MKSASTALHSTASSGGKSSCISAARWRPPTSRSWRSSCPTISTPCSPACKSALTGSEVAPKKKAAGIRQPNILGRLKGTFLRLPRRGVARRRLHHGCDHAADEAGSYGDGKQGNPHVCPP